jgi:ribonuclease HI
VECNNNGEAELRALLLAMSAAEQAKLRNVIFSTDCESAARPHRGESEHLRPLREEACRYLARHQPGWSITQISRTENVLAHALARQARRSHDDVSVSVDSVVAAALIERAGIIETTEGRWRVAPDRRIEHRRSAERRAAEARRRRREPRELTGKMCLFAGLSSGEKRT